MVNFEKKKRTITNREKRKEDGGEEITIAYKQINHFYKKIINERSRILVLLRIIQKLLAYSELQKI